MTRRHHAFTLVELLTVAFILGVMVALILPAVQRFRAYAQRKKTDQIIQAVRLGIGTYQRDFQKLPPSEPDMVSNDYYGRTWGGASLLNHLNGSDGTGYKMSYGPWNASTRIWDPRVTNVQITTGSNGGFQDGWGNIIDYFVAYKDRAEWRSGWSRSNPGETAADVFPRACNVNLSGAGDYLYTYTVGSSGSPSRIGGKGVHVAVARWLDGWTGYASGWQYHAVPTNIGDFILVSSGADGLWGTADDVGDVGRWEE